MPSSQTITNKGIEIEYINHGEDEDIEIVDIQFLTMPSCGDCTTINLQAILYDKIDCYRTCPKWQEWRRSLRGKVDGNKA